jgi:enamine deaminase RidA (YjgF/YER057c/UK114 family)
MMKKQTNLIKFGATFALPLCLMGSPLSHAEEPKPTEVEFFIPPAADGSVRPNPFLASGVGVGKNVAVYYSAGTGPGFFAECNDPDDPTLRWINPEFFTTGCELPEGVSITEAQGMNALNRIAENLEAQGLTLEDVIFLRIYLAAPPGEEIADYSGWNEAYRKFFANVDLVTGDTLAQYEPIVFINPTRPARTNIEVASLPVSGWLVELEAVAAFPK